MVVMGHTLIVCMNDMGSCVPARLIAGIHMPLFFFISGWFTAKVDGNGRLVTPDLKRRFTQLIIPTAVAGCLYFLVLPSLGFSDTEGLSFTKFWLSPSKMGYWFGICLFEIMLVYTVMLPLLRKIHGAVSTLLLSFGICAALLVISSVAKNITEPLEVLETGCYLFPFMTGVVASRHREGFEKLLNNNAVMTISIVVLSVCLWFQTNPVEMRYIVISRLISHVPLALLAVAVFKPWSDEQYARPQSPGAAVRIWSYLGRNSLGIYLLHYFFLFPMRQVEDFIAPMCPGFVPLVVTAIFSAVLITACVCGIIELLKPSRLLSKILTGA